LVGVGVESEARTHALIIDGGVFAVSLLARRDRALVRRFVKPVDDVSVDAVSGRGTMNAVAVHGAVTGAPILDGALAWIDCRLHRSVPLGSHTWFIGEVVDAGLGDDAPETGPVGGSGDDGVLRLEDTRMNYGG
ncbi:MAG: flavin reductase family protein, partial [Acidimicrobiales bacterium]